MGHSTPLPEDLFVTAATSTPQPTPDPTPEPTLKPMSKPMPEPNGGDVEFGWLHRQHVERGEAK